MPFNLKPCPFCGAPAEMEYTPWNEETQAGDDGSGWVECTSCHVQMFGLSVDDAEELWNHRITPWLPIDTAPTGPGVKILGRENGEVYAIVWATNGARSGWHDGDQMIEPTEWMPIPS